MTVDASSSNSTGSTASTTLSWTHTVGASGNRQLFVGVSINRPAGGASVSGITCGVSPLALVGANDSTPTPNGTRIEIWTLANPPSGACTVTVTLSAAAEFVGGATSFFGVDPTTPYSGYVSATAISSPVSVTVASAAGNLVLDTVAIRGDGSAVAPGASQTQRWLSQTEANNSGVWGGGSTAAGAASVTMSWTVTSGNRLVIGAVSVNAVAPTPDANPHAHGDADDHADHHSDVHSHTDGDADDHADSSRPHRP